MKETKELPKQMSDEQTKDFLFDMFKSYESVRNYTTKGTLFLTLELNSLGMLSLVNLSSDNPMKKDNKTFDDDDEDGLVMPQFGEGLKIGNFKPQDYIG